MHPNKSRSCSLANGLSGEILDRLTLDNGSGKLSNDGDSFIKDIRKTGKKVLCFCDFLVKVFDITWYSFNYIFLYFQIF